MLHVIKNEHECNSKVFSQNEAERDKWESISGGLESMEQLSSWGMSMPNIGELTEEAMTAVYNKYTFKKREDTFKLAIEEYKQEVMYFHSHNLILLFQFHFTTYPD